MAEEVTITIVLPVLVGIIIGIIEAYFVYEDENMTSGKDFLGDMWHGLVFSVLGVLVVSNVVWLLAQPWFPEWLKGLLFVDAMGHSLVASIAIFIFMYVKMVASHAVRGVSGRGFKEKAWHKLVVAALVAFAPYYLDLVRPLLEPVAAIFPPWLPI